MVDPSPLQRSNGRNCRNFPQGLPGPFGTGGRGRTLKLGPQLSARPPGQRSGGGDRGVRLRGAVSIKWGPNRGRILCLRLRSGPVLTSCTSTFLTNLLQLVVPEQLPIAVIEQDSEGGVA